MGNVLKRHSGQNFSMLSLKGQTQRGMGYVTEIIFLINGHSLEGKEEQYLFNNCVTQENTHSSKGLFPTVRYNQNGPCAPIINTSSCVQGGNTL